MSRRKHIQVQDDPDVGNQHHIHSQLRERTQGVRRALAASQQLHELLFFQLEQQPRVLCNMYEHVFSGSWGERSCAKLCLLRCRRCVPLRNVHLRRPDLEHGGVDRICCQKALCHIASPNCISHRLALPAAHTGGVVLPGALRRTSTGEGSRAAKQLTPPAHSKHALSCCPNRHSCYETPGKALTSTMSSTTMYCRTSESSCARFTAAGGAACAALC